MTYEQAKAAADEIHADYTKKGAALNAFIGKFPNGPMGLTPDTVKAMPEYKTLKAALDKSFARVRQYNTWYTKQFKKERDAELAAKFAAFAAIK